MPQDRKTEEDALHLLNAREAAEYLRISLATLNRMEKKGHLQSLRTPGGHRRYTLTMLNACLAPYSQLEREVDP